MAPRRLIASCLGIVAAGLLVAGCGSGSDSTSADIDPLDAADLTGQLDRIQAFFEEGNCDRAVGAVDNMGVAVDKISDKTGEQFTTDAQKLVDNLRAQVEDECQPPDPTTSSTTTESTDTEPPVTDTQPDTSSTTSSTTKSTTSSTSTSSTSTPTPPTGPGNNNGNGNGPPNTPGGGISPGGKKEAPDARIKKPKPEKPGKKDKGKGGKHEKDKEHGR